MIVISDIHLTVNNKNSKKELIGEAINFAIENNESTICIAGDLFHQRGKAIPLELFDFYDDIFSSHSLNWIILPGNHDKIDLNSQSSYLDLFKHNPKVTLVRNFLMNVEEFDDTYLHFLPYFKEEDGVYLKNLQNIIDYFKPDKFNILITHIGAGSFKDNKGHVVNSCLSSDLFKKFDLVLSGHYHNKGKVADNFYYFGSIGPTNFGEDNDKGFIQIRRKRFVSHKTTSFKPYYTIECDLDQISLVELNQELEKYDTQKQNVRISFKGSIQKIKSVDFDFYKRRGFIIKKSDIVLIKNSSDNERISFTNEEIFEEFELYFSHIEEDTRQIGRKYLNKTLQK